MVPTYDVLSFQTAIYVEGGQGPNQLASPSGGGINTPSEVRLYQTFPGLRSNVEHSVTIADGQGTNENLLLLVDAFMSVLVIFGLRIWNHLHRL